MKWINFIQGNGQTVKAKISQESKRKFGSFGWMWVITFDNDTHHYMDKDTILKATGIDMSKRGGIYHKDNQAIINAQSE